MTRATKAANAGTLRYMSPEQLDEQLNTKIDIWALGCVLLQLVTGKAPFEGITNEFKIYTEVCKRGPLEYAQIHFKEELESNAMFTKSAELRDFLEQCL